MAPRLLLAQHFRHLGHHAAIHEISAVAVRAFAACRHSGTDGPMSPSRFADHREAKPRRDPVVSRRRAFLVIPALGVLVLVLLWTVIFARLSVEKEATYREAMASAAILSAALEQHTIKAIHQVDQITRFVKYEFEKTPNHFDLSGTVEKGVVQSETLVQVSLIDEHGRLIANTAEVNPKHIDLSDREHFKVHEHENDDQLYINKPVLGRVSGHWTLQMTRRLRPLTWPQRRRPRWRPSDPHRRRETPPTASRWSTRREPTRRRRVR